VRSRRLPWPCSDERTVLSYTGCAAAVQARPGLFRVSGSHSQGTLGYRLPARSSILRRPDASMARAREMGPRASELTRATAPGRGNAMPQPPRQEQQPISAMDFLRGTPGQFRAHKQLPVEPEPVRTGRIPKRTRKLVWAIFGLWTLTIVGAVAYLQLKVYAGQIQRAANSAQLTPAASSGAGDATQPAQEPPSALNAIDDTAATEPPAQASPPLAGPAPGTSRPLHPSIQPASLPPVATPA